MVLLAWLAVCWYGWQVLLPGPIDYRPGWLLLGLYALPMVVVVAAMAGIRTS